LSSSLPYNENELATRLATGDEAVFAQLYNAYWNKIYSLALIYLKSVELAQDAVQEVFLKLWARREQMAKVKNLEAFIFIMGRNLVIDSLKKKISNLAIYQDTDDCLPDDLLLPHDQVDLKQLQKNIADAIEKLPPQQKNIFRMSREDGLNHEQIAQRLGIGKKTVKNHIVRALNTLRILLHDHESLLLLLFFIEWVTKN
jgi:RNA polymerase sigma-70 factor (family 1)